MKQSQLFFKTRKEVPSDADSINASYLIRAGFVEKYMAGVFAILPLGYLVMDKIEKVVREEMNKIGGQELLLNVLQPKEIWEETGRWDGMREIFYQFTDSRGKALGLAPTHEEEITTIVKSVVSSYKDLPISLYQIQTKFRNEPRVKSGLLRGREFIMKDMYSFHATKEDLEKYYELVKETYFQIFKRFGLEAKVVRASGGDFSEYSHEFQVISKTGEDTIYYCNKCGYAVNKEISEVLKGDKCPECEDGKIFEARSIEVGNIFPLYDKYSKALNATFSDESGKQKAIVMGCYGIGITRALATVVETKYDISNNKMLWPKEIAPYSIHLISINKNETSDKLYDLLMKAKISVLYDDRGCSAGEKFAEADLIGCPKRIIVSDRSEKSGGVEVIDLSDNSSKIVKLDAVINEINEK